MSPEAPVYLINLDRSPDRLAHASTQLDRLGVEWTRIPAADGRLIPREELDKLAPRSLAAESWHQPLSPGEVGCYMSHVKCWRRLVDSGARAAVILEDDFTADDALPRIVDAVLRSDVPWDMVKLFGTKHGRIDYGELVPGFRLAAYGRAPAYTVAQIVSRDAAERLLSRVPPFARPIDMDLKWWWSWGLRLLSVDPPPVRPPPADVAGSVIAADRQRRPRTLGGQLRRARYRLRFALGNFRANARSLGLGRALALEAGLTVRPR